MARYQVTPHIALRWSAEIGRITILLTLPGSLSRSLSTRLIPYGGGTVGKLVVAIRRSLLQCLSDFFVYLRERMMLGFAALYPTYELRARKPGISMGVLSQDWLSHSLSTRLIPTRSLRPGGRSYVNWFVGHEWNSPVLPLIVPHRVLPDTEETVGSAHPTDC